jgi:hypothetical protein
MKRSIFVILACIFILPFIARSQNEGIKTTSNPRPVANESFQMQSTQQLAMIQDQGTSGGAPLPSGISAENSPLYLEPGWAPGRVLLNDQSIMDNVLLRYDIYHQQIQFIRENDTMAFSRPEEVECFILDGRKFIYTDFQNSGIVGKSYFEIISDGSCRLLLHRSIKYHMDPESVSNLKNDLYIRECEYYIEKNGEMARPVKACRKSVLCAFKDKEEQVKEYMHDNNLKMNTCDQLKDVVAYYNSLQ